MRSFVKTSPAHGVGHRDPLDRRVEHRLELRSLPSNLLEARRKCFRHRVEVPRQRRRLVRPGALLRPSRPVALPQLACGAGDILDRFDRRADEYTARRGGTRSNADAARPPRPRTTARRSLRSALSLRARVSARCRLTNSSNWRRKRSTRRLPSSVATSRAASTRSTATASTTRCDQFSAYESIPDRIWSTRRRWAGSTTSVRSSSAAIG